MSNRHRTTDVVLPHHEERRVQARSERHRVNTALNDVTGQILGGAEPDDVLAKLDGAVARGTFTGTYKRAEQ